LAGLESARAVRRWLVVNPGGSAGGGSLIGFDCIFAPPLLSPGLVMATGDIELQFLVF
jgi:hypothetical protein